MNHSAKKPESKIKFSPQEWEEKLRQIQRWQIEPDTGQKPDFKNHDLSYVDLSGKNLYGVNFEGADLTGVNLTGADLTGANLKKVRLVRARLARATLKGVNLSNAILEDCSLAEAVFEGANFSGATLSRMNLEFADLSAINFSGAILKETNLHGTKLIKTNLSRASLIQANIDHSDLTEANLEKADLTEAYLNHSILASANLEGAILHHSSLPHANLEKANLVRAEFTGANLKKAVLRNGSLKHTLLMIVNMEDADLTKANLSHARLDDGVFRRANFQGAKLNHCSLKNADLNDANFSECLLNRADLSRKRHDLALPGRVNFSKADLSEAILIDADLSGSNLIGTNFQGALLIGANLTRTRTSGMNLGGSDVTDAELPEDLKNFHRLKSVEDASLVARKLFAWLLGGLAFSGLTIASTNDIQLLLNTTSSPLPIIQTPFPIAGFYFLAPLILLGLFLYFHLQLQHQWKLISRLPAVFPDGMPLDEKIFPWLLNSWVRNFLPPTHRHKGILPVLKRVFTMENILSMLRNFLVVVMVWYATPALLLAFWARYLPRHDWTGTRLQIVAVILATFFSFGFHCLARHTLRNKTLPFLKGILFSTLVALPFLCFTSSLSFKAIQGDLNRDYLEIRILPWEVPFLKTGFLVQIPDTWNIPQRLNHWLRANFTEQEVSVKPDNYDPFRPEDIKWVRGAKLENANLNYVLAQTAFLVNAKMSGASLIGANLYQAQLKGAVLRNASFKNADLRFADLSHADLTNADLSGADLREANLESADLTGANLPGADLANADISNAVFYDVHGLTLDQVKSATHWKEGLYDNTMKIQLGVFFSQSK